MSSLNEESRAIARFLATKYGASSTLLPAPGDLPAVARFETAVSVEQAQFDAVVVTRYLFRPRLDRLAALLRPGGVLIYETFMLGNERFGKPSNPDFLLRPHELLDWARGWGSVLAFEQGEIARPAPAMIQRICALRGDTLPGLP